MLSLHAQWNSILTILNEKKKTYIVGEAQLGFLKKTKRTVPVAWVCRSLGLNPGVDKMWPVGQIWPIR
ncbi:hypothetical protein Y1Q_0000908 [Alligator mississippiensis]|uniref:Uncharacterized protein n=1 Tax=Alligator mississippiensis TaxID=8496 RepID=A0A151NDV6_ALLMI|nr:hypothetical protein Y1Q_0000908 [Alligator mississippiensis]